MNRIFASAVLVVLVGCGSSVATPQDAAPEKDVRSRDVAAVSPDSGDLCSACNPKTETCNSTLETKSGTSGTYSTGCTAIPAACAHDVTCTCIQKAESMASSDGYICEVITDAGLIFTRFNE